MYSSGVVGYMDLSTHQIAVTDCNYASINVHKKYIISLGNDIKRQKKE